LDQVTYKHLALDLDVDFDARVIRGCATWRLSLSEACTLIKLDTKSLSITSVRACAALDLPADASPHTDLSKMSSEIPFTLVEHPLNPHAFGSALTISLTEMVGADGGVLPQGDILLAIHYRTASDSIALQWLTPEQTAGKQYPYVFSQCQAIHARALLPCPDAPCAKVGYSARLTVPEWATAVMSAPAAGRERLSDGTKHRFDFEQEVPIPSYLLALAVGELESRVVGPRSKVWAEPSVVDAAAYEFSETESFICAAEKIAGMPYAWGESTLSLVPIFGPHLTRPSHTRISPISHARLTRPSHTRISHPHLTHPMSHPMISPEMTRLRLSPPCFARSRLV
jgi:leukotriene-A4 hydrolase|tara:strand:- start:616 stop:1638 length:1023 start_codon:yes stop_codon:yes gene_type:complete